MESELAERNRLYTGSPDSSAKAGQGDASNDSSGGDELFEWKDGGFFLIQCGKTATEKQVAADCGLLGPRLDRTRSLSHFLEDFGSVPTCRKHIEPRAGHEAASARSDSVRNGSFGIAWEWPLADSLTQSIETMVY
jgi:hypothetical protein